MEERNTLQKTIIHRTLCNMRGQHPTATAVYTDVHKDHPTISRSTVYRVLARMAEEGKILRLELAASDTRYDGQTMPHSHVRCRVCGTVADIPAVEMRAPSATAGFTLEDCTVIYRGLCPACRKAEAF